MFRDFSKAIESFDNSLYECYFESPKNLQISTDFISNIVSKIKEPQQNTKEYNVYQEIIKNAQELFEKFEFLPSNLINQDLADLIHSKIKKEVVTFGTLRTCDISYCISCFRELKQKGESLEDSDPISLKFCHHTFCRSCLRNYILKSTNNLVFLTRADSANKNRRILKCLKSDCGLVLFLEDYYSVFGCERFEIIVQNYNSRFENLAFVIYFNNHRLKINSTV
jgi:hypothetical protein